MQIFGDRVVNTSNDVNAGGVEIKTIKVSSLPIGTHTIRLYPLSSQFYEGGDQFAIVQMVHWINKKPVVCRRTSWDYDVPDTEEKPYLDPSTCCICSDKFAQYKKAKEVGKETQEGVMFSSIGKDLMEKIKVSSLVSFVDANGNVNTPVILRYGKELYEKISQHAERILVGQGVHICDPTKGYRFDIIIKNKRSGYRTYVDSLPNIDLSPLDITKAPWKWNEICNVIKQEIVPAKSPEEVKSFYLVNYGDNTDEFTHPAFMNQGSNQQVNTIPVDAAAPVAVFNPGNVQAEDTKVVENIQPVNNVIPKFSPGNAPTAEYPPCHSNSPGGSGFDSNDATCHACTSPAKAACKQSVRPFTDINATKPVATTTADNVANKLKELNNKMLNQ